MERDPLTLVVALLIVGIIGTTALAVAGVPAPPAWTGVPVGLAVGLLLIVASTWR